MRLTPRDSRFYAMFSDAAAHLVIGAGLLSELLAADPDARPAVAERMRDAEHEADETTHLIMQTVNSTFITPFAREDIYALASQLDDVMDAMDAAVDMIVLYAIDDLPPEFSDQVRVLARAAELTAGAMPRLRTMPATFRARTFSSSSADGPLAVNFAISSSTIRSICAMSAPGLPVTLTVKRPAISLRPAFAKTPVAVCSS